jgi:hypothetical protein
MSGSAPINLVIAGGVSAGDDNPDLRCGDQCSCRFGDLSTSVVGSRARQPPARKQAAVVPPPGRP